MSASDEIDIVRLIEEAEDDPAKAGVAFGVLYSLTKKLLNTGNLGGKMFNAANLFVMDAKEALKAKADTE